MQSLMELDLEERKSKGLFRQLRKLDPDVIDFSSNDYLGLKKHPAMIKAAAEGAALYGTGSGSSRLISGNSTLYEKLESDLRDFKKVPSALVASSGYALNVSLIPTLVSAGDAVILDRLSHASLIDGARLSGARLFVYKHSDMNSLEQVLKRAAKFRRKLIVTDTVFSMDGDIAPIAEIAGLADKYGAETLVDEAHATGVTGAEGRGVVDYLSLSKKIDYSVGTFSKALGSSGGFVVSRHKSAESYFLNTVRGVIFSTALPPSVIAASIKGVELSRSADVEREHLRSMTKMVRNELGLKVSNDEVLLSAIVPVIVGDEKKCLELSQLLLARGVFVPPVRFPTVAKGAARLRISLSARHSVLHIKELVEQIKELLN